MHARLHAGWWLAAALATAGTLAVTVHSAAPARQSAIAYLAEPTLIGSTFVVGPVVITHDAMKMSHGAPCTTVQLYDPAKHRATEEIASFQCVPRAGGLVAKLTLTTRPSTLGFGCVLTAYQFAGDREVHGVPQPVDAE